MGTVVDPAIVAYLTAGKQTGKQTGRQADRQAGRHTDRQAGSGQVGRQIEGR